MTSKFYQTLKLPGNPFVPGAIETLRKTKMKAALGGNPHYQTIHYDCDNFLTEETLNIFQSVGATPFYIIHFGSVKNLITKTFLHTDLYWMEDRYQIVPFGINWDLAGGTTDFRWYDNGDIPEAWPPHKIAEFSGLHYGQRQSTSIEGCNELDSLLIERNTAYLVRTDVPHQITYTCDEPMRYGVSIRFKLEDISDWDHALKVFEPLFMVE